MFCLYWKLYKYDIIIFKPIPQYIKEPKCILKRSKKQLESIEEFKIELSKISENINALGLYPLLKGVKYSADIPLRSSNNAYYVPPPSVRSNISISPLKSDEFVNFLGDVRSYLEKQARELIVCNISDLSGQPSKFPHTICGATFLSSASLKVVVRDCLKETRKMIEQNHAGAVVLNYGLDGESVHLATSKSNGEPGTLIL